MPRNKKQEAEYWNGAGHEWLAHVASCKMNTAAASEDLTGCLGRKGRRKSRDLHREDGAFERIQGTGAQKRDVALHGAGGGSVDSRIGRRGGSWRKNAGLW